MSPKKQVDAHTIGIIVMEALEEIFATKAWTIDLPTHLREEVVSFENVAGDNTNILLRTARKTFRIRISQVNGGKHE